MSEPYDQYGYPVGDERAAPAPAVQEPDAPRQFDMEKLRAELEADEGERLDLYRCTAGKLTIGIGHNIEDRGISPATSEFIFREDTAEAVADLDISDPGWREHPNEVQRALINLMFNLGRSRWEKFTNTRAALARKDYAAAARGLENSKWAKQVQPSRKDRIIAQVRGAAG